MFTKMAEALEGMEHLLRCHVCLEEFTKSDDHIPRLLPCTHTLCTSCIKQLIRDNKLECPECRTKHEAENEEKSFPQNKYILSQLKRGATDNRNEEYNFQQCEEHGKELNLFCKQDGCNNSICRSCLSKKHFGHKVVEVEEQRKEVLLRIIETIEKHLGTIFTKISEAKDEIERRNDEISPKMKIREEEMNTELQELARQAKENEDEVNAKVDNEVAVLQRYLNLLEDTKQNINTNEENTYEDLVSELENVAKITKALQKDHSGERRFPYSEYHASYNFCFGHLEIGELTIELPEAIEKVSPLNCTGKPHGFKFINLEQSIIE